MSLYSLRLQVSVISPAEGPDGFLSDGGPGGPCISGAAGQAPRGPQSEGSMTSALLPHPRASHFRLNW